MNIVGKGGVASLFSINVFPNIFLRIVEGLMQ